MDNTKVNGLPGMPHATAAQLPGASKAAADRFSQAMGETSGRGAIGGAAIPDLTREASQDNRDHAYERLRGPLGGGVASAIACDVAANSLQEPTRVHVDPTEVVISGSVWSQLGVATQARAMATPRRASEGELTQMLERMCSALYVGDKSVGTQRIVMALDHVMPGAAAEIVREGVHLSIRLHARTEESFRAMSSQRDALIRALSGDAQRRLEVTVVQGSGDGHG